MAERRARRGPVGLAVALATTDRVRPDLLGAGGTAVSDAERDAAAETATRLATRIADLEGVTAEAEVALQRTRTAATKRILDGVRAAAAAIVAADDRAIAALEAEHRKRLRERDGLADAEAARDVLALLIAEQG